MILMMMMMTKARGSVTGDCTLRPTCAYVRNSCDVVTEHHIDRTYIKLIDFGQAKEIRSRPVTNYTPLTTIPLVFNNVIGVSQQCSPSLSPPLPPSPLLVGSLTPSMHADVRSTALPSSICVIPRYNRIGHLSPTMWEPDGTGRQK